VYLDEATVENGCLWVIPGSHRMGHIQAPKDRGVIGGLYTDISYIPDLTPEPITAPAGSAIFFDGYIVHGSMTNRTDGDRRALIFTYQPAGLPRWNHKDVRLPVSMRRTDSRLHALWEGIVTAGRRKSPRQPSPQ
jgi:ectoine hydroxylase-related dioxygenase (phytanoyl-CoA dioxygenase family)